MRFLRIFPIIFGFSILFGVAFIGLVVAPGVTSEVVRSPSPGLVAYSRTEAHGREIYVREGCVYCHSQQVRNVKADENLVLSFGVSKAGDYYYDRPHLLGTSRQGPDLSNEGQIWSREIGEPARDYLINHFINPREYNPSSIMPSFSYLSTEELSDLTDYVQSLGAWKAAAQAVEDALS
jgi:cytochrome c oxidase cbb3-type subunit II